jgi:hypothetical protein
MADFREDINEFEKLSSKLGHLIIFINFLKKSHFAGKEIISREELKDFLFPSKINQETLNNVISCRNINGIEGYLINDILTILNNDLFQYKGFNDNENKESYLTS